LFLEGVSGFSRLEPAQQLNDPEILGHQTGIHLGMKTVFIKGVPQFQKPGAGEAVCLAARVSPSSLGAVTAHFGL
jgi:hypothetical protein